MLIDGLAECTVQTCRSAILRSREGNEGDGRLTGDEDQASVDQ